MQKRLLPLCLLALVSLASSSCGLNPKKYFSKKVNLAGVVTHEPASYTPIETGTFRLSSDELGEPERPQGWKNHSFLGFAYLHGLLICKFAS